MAEKQNPIPNSNYIFEHFFELSADLLCIAGFDGFFKKINPAVSQLLGYTNEELFSRPINDFVYHEDKDITAKVRNQLHNNKPLFHFENRYVTKNGEIVWLSWTSMPVEDEKLVYAIAKNITHTKKIEEERNQLLKKITTINSDLKKLSFTSSHDLRSPVNNLLSIFDLLDISKIEDSETLEFIEMMKIACETLKQTLNDYVDVLIMEDRTIAQIEELDLNECLNTVTRSINSLIQNSKTVINVDFSEIEKINFNKAYLESIYLNLITNSIKYAQPGHSPVISISSRDNDGINQLIFSDNGSGFDMKMVKDKIFGLHQKFHNHIDSKGIGLYLVNSHITSLGGKIDVESTINKGTTFTISFKKELN
ncbi:PAS domain-containing sensor histidine kinase [Flavobacterium gilvum]|uniref:histidine kinase n=1 Tax=Flavobacterium gilvum TaxID=1492737 RepID=A0AAC9I306_9FLAO|nr:PAS domain-containing sensor histidine kinase [Flavobacterium gilvum]AOW09879.1 PAS domain-containing sensor histidine kinase [Flavobacterium gilvum]KFC58578.1 histidine kinase [Flavobacterium gilvum]